MKKAVLVIWLFNEGSVHKIWLIQLFSSLFSARVLYIDNFFSFFSVQKSKQALSDAGNKTSQALKNVGNMTASKWQEIK